MYSSTAGDDLDLWADVGIGNQQGGDIGHLPDGDDRDFTGMRVDLTAQELHAAGLVQRGRSDAGPWYRVRGE